ETVVTESETSAAAGTYSSLTGRTSGLPCSVIRDRIAAIESGTKDLNSPLFSDAFAEWRWRNIFPLVIWGRIQAWREGQNGLRATAVPHCPSETECRPWSRFHDKSGSTPYV